MTDEQEQGPDVRRIVVTLDASACGRAALETAAELAAELQAELQGLFVEDIALLRLANLPFAHEVLLASASPRQLETSHIQNALRSDAARVRQAVTCAADQRHLRWSFQVLQGDAVRISRTAAGQAELLILGCAETVASGSPHAAGQPSKAAATAGSILVIDDGSTASDHVLRAAVSLARMKGSELLVLSPAHDRGEQRRRQIDGCLQSSGIEYAVQPLAAADARTITRAAERLRRGLQLLVLSCDLLDEADLEILVKRLECPLVLVP